MRQTLSGYDERDDGLHLVGEDRLDEYVPPDRRLPKIFLSMLVMALFAGGLWFAYVQGTRHPASGIQPGVAAGVQGGAQGDGVPLLRADERPTKVRPDQPGGMAIPDQNVSLYNDKPGGPPVEKLLPAAEQPLPRPVPPPREAAIPSSPPGPPPIPGTTLPGAPAVNPPAIAPLTSSPAAHPAPKTGATTAPTAKAASQPKQVPPHQAAAPAGKGPIQLRLASVRSPEAARDEWARLKRENSDLLGKLTAVAVRADLGEQGIYYRVQAGSFGDAAAAEKLCGELKRRGLGCILAR